ncbi:uncharacterized protein VTP21DRAFT_6321 [Calcarisporiella thermophila]|uniref:uncharacterized protein n=1 Tax=Calcarisporiella thermophila TaxID=911321 RepID=UPI003742D788
MELTLLDKILTNKEHSPLIVVSDTVEQSGWDVLKAFWKRDLQSEHNRSLVLVLNETSPDIININEKVTIIDCFSNPGWEEKVNDSSSTKIIRVTGIQLVSETVESLAKEAIASGRKFTLVFDSLSNFFMINTRMTLKMLSRLSQCASETCRIVALYHDDIPTSDAFTNSSATPSCIPELTASLSYYAPTVIRVISLRQAQLETADMITKATRMSLEKTSLVDVASNSIADFVCCVEHRKPSGKVLKEIVMCKIVEGQEWIHTSPYNVIREENLTDVKENQPDPTLELTTFNLSLTEEQKRAKNQVVLPYTKAQQQGELSGGTIFYEPDAEDDFDDEDPDDDLDI